MNYHLKSQRGYTELKYEVTYVPNNPTEPPNYNIGHQENLWAIKCGSHEDRIQIVIIENIAAE